MSDDRTRYLLDLTDGEAAELRALVPAGTLRRKPARRVREAPDYAATVHRMVTALGRRAGDDDPDQVLPILRELATTIEAVTGDAIRTWHAAGYSWAELGRALGLTKQAVQKRYGVNRELT